MMKMKKIRRCLSRSIEACTWLAAFGVIVIVGEGVGIIEIIWATKSSRVTLDIDES